MSKHHSQIAWLFMFNLLLSACASMDMKSPAMKRAICNQLRSDIILHPASADERIEEIQRSEEYLQAYNYDVDCENSYSGSLYRSSKS